MKRIERIEKMEKLMNDYNQLTSEFSEALEKLKSAQDQWQELSDYYLGDQWIDDKEVQEGGGLPKDLRCGVLSEDELYNVLTKNHYMAVEMLELATKMIKNY